MDKLTQRGLFLAVFDQYWVRLLANNAAISSKINSGELREAIIKEKVREQAKKEYQQQTKMSFLNTTKKYDRHTFLVAIVDAIGWSAREGLSYLNTNPTTTISMGNQIKLHFQDGGQPIIGGPKNDTMDLYLPYLRPVA